MGKTDNEEESYSEDDEEKEVSSSNLANDHNDKDEKLTSDNDGFIKCLACGSNSSAVNIKTELEDECENDGENNYEIRGNSSSNCLGSKEENEKQLIMIAPPDEFEAEKIVFINFCKLLGVRLSGIKLDSDSEDVKAGVVPSFCQICRNQLGLLLDLQEKLKELEKDLDNGIQEFKKMCQKSEDKFQVSQVYEKDKTYLQIRRQICGNRVQNDDENSLKSTEKSDDSILLPEPTRKCTRNSTKVNAKSTSSAVATEEDEVLIKLELEVPNVEDDNEEDGFDLDNHVPLDSPFDEDDENVQSSDDDDYEYEPPIKKKKPLAPVPKKRKKPGRPATKKKKRCTPAAKKIARKTDKKMTKGEMDLAPSDDEEESDDDVEASLKGRMSTDPSTGHVIFLNVSFEALDGGRYRCLTCEKDSAYHRGSLKKHVITMHTDMFVCQECNQHCPSSKSLNSHIRRVHRGLDQKTVECPVCGKPCSSKRGRMEKHMGTHLSSQEKEEAKARGEEIPQWSKLRRHVCEECGRGYELRAHLIQHKIREHPSTDYTEDDKMACKEMCPDCGKLVHRHYLKKHQEFVHSEGVVKRFSCMLCEKRFVKESDLRKHKSVVHEKIRPYKCTMCTKQFALKTQLNYHLHTHQNIRPFQCDHCPMAFARKHHLERHFRIYHEPGASPPKRKTYIKGPETKCKGEVQRASVQEGGRLESSQQFSGGAEGGGDGGREDMMVPLALDTHHQQHQQQIMAWMDQSPTRN